MGNVDWIAGGAIIYVWDTRRTVDGTERKNIRSGLAGIRQVSICTCKLIMFSLIFQVKGCLLEIDEAFDGQSASEGVKWGQGRFEWRGPARTGSVDCGVGVGMG